MPSRPCYEGRLISVIRRWGGERWLVGVSEIRRNKPISGPSRLVPAHLRVSRGPSMGGLTTGRGLSQSVLDPKAVDRQPANSKEEAGWLPER